MRIIIDIRPMLESQRSGVANYAACLLDALTERPSSPDRDYALFCNAWKRPLPPDLPPAAAHLEYRFSHYPNRLLNAGFACLGRPLIEDLAGGADLVYLPNLNFVATKKPLIVTVHDLSFARFPEFFSAKQRLWHAAVGPRRLLRRAAAVVAVSEHTKRDIVETYGLSTEKISVISPGVGAEYRPADAASIAAVREKYGLKNGYFLYLATLEPRKNVIGLIAAFETLEGETELVLAGGKGWLYKDIFRRAAASPARERIRFLDYVGEADKPALYSAATALAYPSFYEGFGLPPLEAMACGTPVVASHATSLGEVVGDAGILVDPHDITALADGLREVRDDGALRAELSRRGMERAKMFTWEKSAEKLDELFRKHCG